MRRASYRVPMFKWNLPSSNTIPKRLDIYFFLFLFFFFLLFLVWVLLLNDRPALLIQDTAAAKKARGSRERERGR